MPEPKLAERPADADAEDLAWVGREFLVWLLWRADRGEGQLGQGDEAFTVGFGSRIRLKAVAGDVTDAVLRGGAAPYSIETRAGVGAGRTPREADLRFARGDREWRFTLEAETLDLRGVKLPALLTEEDDDRFLERIALVEELDAMVKAAFAEFLRDRTRPAWGRSVVPAIGSWLAEALSCTARPSGV